MAHKKAGGSSRNGRDSESKRLGVKRYGGQEVVIAEVLAVGNGADIKVGTPLVAGASVKATVVAHGKHDKVRIFKMRRRKHYKKSQGHRQTYTELRIEAISA